MGNLFTKNASSAEEKTSNERNSETIKVKTYLFFYCILF